MKRTTCTACGEPLEPRGVHGRVPVRCDRCKDEYRRAYAREHARRQYASNPDVRDRRIQAAIEYKARRRASGWKDDKMRRYAREEARERGVPVEQVLKEWRA